MKIAWIAFTAKGAETGRRLVSAFDRTEGTAGCRKTMICESVYDEWTGYLKGRFSIGEKGTEQCVETSLQEWTKHIFLQQDAILFIGAAGIAVRAIAPFLKSKTEDPAVLVMDEQGNHIIPLVSGHIGGANRLAHKVAEALGAEAVITTATDLNGKFAVDVWAKENGLLISDMKLAKRVSADLLQGKDVGFFCEAPLQTAGQLPDGLVEQKRQSNIRLSIYEEEAGSLHLIPKAVVLGIGCRRGIAEETILRFVEDTLAEYGIQKASVALVGSIDLKADEKGLQDFCRRQGWDSVFFQAEQLRQMEGNFTSSSFVEEVTGVDNICERAALAAAAELTYCGRSDGDFLMIRKRAKDGVTLAVAVKSIIYQF